MTGSEDTERGPDRPWRMPEAYRHFLRPRRPSEIFTAERAQQGSDASDELDEQGGDADREPA